MHHLPGDLLDALRVMASDRLRYGDRLKAFCHSAMAVVRPHIGRRKTATSRLMAITDGDGRKDAINDYCELLTGCDVWRDDTDDDEGWRRPGRDPNITRGQEACAAVALLELAEVVRDLDNCWPCVGGLEIGVAHLRAFRQGDAYWRELIPGE